MAKLKLIAAALSKNAYDELKELVLELHKHNKPIPSSLRDGFEHATKEINRGNLSEANSISRQALRRYGNEPAWLSPMD